jgi:hypothetical protein
MSKHLFYNSWWNIKQVRKGKVIWEINKKNSLVDEGEEVILETVFRRNSLFIPTEFYVRLCTGSILETHGLVDILGEPVGNGYTPQLLEASSEGFPTKEIDAGDYMLTSKEITFTATGGNIGPVSTAFLATTLDNEGRLMAFVSLALQRTILENDSMIIQIKIKLQ